MTTDEPNAAGAESLCGLDDAPAWKHPDIHRDPEDVLHARLEQLQGLSSCFGVLAYADRCAQVPLELIDCALPMLAEVMQELCEDAIRAKGAIDRGESKFRPGRPQSTH